MTRIKLEDSMMDVMIKMAEGNPGAITALMEIHQNSSVIDPQGAMGGLGAILSLDTYGIYGSEIYILWNDKCGRDVREMLILMRACQLGFISQDKLRKMASDQMGEVNLSEEEMDNLDAQVTDRLPQFQKRKEES